MKIRVIVLTVALALVLIVGGVSAQGPVGQGGSGNEVVRYLPEQEGPAGVYAPNVFCGETDSCTTTWVYYGYNSSTSGTRYGLIGGTASSSGIGVYGFRNNTSGTSPAVYGWSGSTAAYSNAVLGVSASTAPGSNAAGVRGISYGTGGTGIGVYGTQNGSGWGVYGYTPRGLGVIGSTSSGTGVYGWSSTGVGSFGVHTSSTGTAPGVYGYSNSRVAYSNAVLGISAYTAPGANAAGVRGISYGTGGTGIGVYGTQNGSGWGVYGYTPRGIGVIGTTGSGRGVYGSSSSGIGLYGYANTGIGIYGYRAATSGTSPAVYGYGRSTTAAAPTIYGYSSPTNPSGFVTGVRGHSNGTAGNGIGVWGSHRAAGWGVYGQVPSLASGYAGWFQGRVRVVGTLFKGGGSFEIDHPLDPANKLLRHSFVESPDMMNVYNGNVALDANGEAFVELPDWFGALNREFRYQLSAIGAPGPNLFIAEEIADNRFKIAGGEPGMTVSWQVTGIRQDAFAEAYRIQVEEDKPEELRGTYLYPDLFGQSADKSLTLRSQGLMGDQLEQLYAPTFDGFAAQEFEQELGSPLGLEELYPLPKLEQELSAGGEIDSMLPESLER